MPRGPSVGPCRGCCSAMMMFLLSVRGYWWGSDVINAEVRRGEAHVQEIAAAGEMERAGFRSKAGALLHQVRNIVGGEGLVDKSILHRPRYGLRGINVAQGHNFAHVVMWVQASRFELEVIGLGARREREKAHEDFMISGFFALLQQGLGVIGIFDILESVILAGMAGNELVPEVNTQAIRIRFQRQSRSEERRVG